MPEESNRLVTDRLSKLHLTRSANADPNFLREGVDAASIVRVGNCMIDSMRVNVDRARRGTALSRFGVKAQGFVLVTLHRPSNVTTQHDSAACRECSPD